jgi:hypothetical protein
MSNFSVTESLLKLKEKNYTQDNIKFLIENYTEEELRILLMRGLRLDNKQLINLYFFENVGFRCINEKSDIVGKLPICRNIENFMNSFYKDFVDKDINI